jgi:NADPH-dependent 2,4-dienoyl-CoA reductase/sulfur reductase-like enzyme
MTDQEPEQLDVLVIGAGAAGLSTVEALRRRGHRGRIALLGGESWAPYDRPPLSKQVLAGTWTPDRARLRPDEALAALEVSLLLGDPATGLDPLTRTVTTAAGRRLVADAVVVATGPRPGCCPGRPRWPGCTSCAPSTTRCG